MVLRAACFAACLALRLAAATSASDNATAVVPPSLDPFYHVPEGLEKVPAGTILKHRRPPSAIGAFVLPATDLVKDSYQLHYRTNDHEGKPSSTVTTVLVPPNADFSKVLSFQVASDSPFGDCAPSFGFQVGAMGFPTIYSEITQLQLVLVLFALQRGWVVAIPDADGQTGAWPSARLAASAVLDGIRAVKKSTAITGIQENATVALWGYSWGGATTLGAIEMQSTYAPELKIAGAALGGGGADLNGVPRAFNLTLRNNKTPAAGFIPVYLLGLSAQFPAIKALVDKHLKPKYREHFYLTQHECLEANAINFKNEDITRFFDDPNFLEKVSNKIEIPFLNFTLPQIPIFWYEWAHDKDTAFVNANVSDFCSKGARIEYLLETATDITHSINAYAVAPRALKWLVGIMNGQAPEPGCSNKTAKFQGLDPGFLAGLPKPLQVRVRQFVTLDPKILDRREFPEGQRKLALGPMET